MELELRFFATFREAAGGKTVVHEFDDAATVGDVLGSLEAEYDGMAGRLITDGALAPQINVLKNGREVLHLSGLDTPLEDGDRLSVFPPVAGGEVDGGTDADTDADGDADAETDPDADGDADTDPDDETGPDAGPNPDTDAPPNEETTKAVPPAADGWVRREVSYRGISRRLAAHYLCNLGGHLVDADTPAAATRVDGDGWRSALSATEVAAAGSITLTEVTVSFTGETATLEELVPKFEQKAIRAGG